MAPVGGGGAAAGFILLARRAHALPRGRLAGRRPSEPLVRRGAARLHGLTLLMGWNVAETVFETSTWPVTLLVAGTVLAELVSPIVYALVALYAGELVWKDRDASVDEIMDAAPVPDGIALLGRFLALVAMIAMFQAALMVGGVLIQALQGHYRFEPGLYLQILFGLKLADYVLFAVLAMTIQVLVNHK